MDAMTTKDLILKELRSLRSGGMTILDMRRKLGLSENTIRRAISELFDENKVFEMQEKRGPSKLWSSRPEKLSRSNCGLGRNTAHLQDVLTTWTKKK